MHGSPHLTKILVLGLSALTPACSGDDGGSSGGADGGGGSGDAGEGDGGGPDGGADGGGDGQTTDGGSGPTPPPPPPGGLDPAGSVQTTTFDEIPGGLPLGLEDYYSFHFIGGPANVSSAQQMYFDSCQTEDGETRFFASMSVGNSEDCPSDQRYGQGGCHGGLVEATYQEDTGLVATGRSAFLPECIEGYGVAAGPNCETVGLLCRRENRAADNAELTKNSLLTHPEAEWMTHPDNAEAGGESTMEEIWLYEWPDGDITGTPERYVVHRAIGTSYGKYSLVLGDDDTYGIGIRSDVFSGVIMHSADALLVLDHSTFDFTNRGYHWSCGAGHTTTNYIGYNPFSGQYASHCLTDHNADGVSGSGQMFTWTESGKENSYWLNYFWEDGAEIGAAASIRPTSDGGWIAAMVTAPSLTGPTDTSFVESGAPTWIGLGRFTPDGVLIGEVQWVVADEEGLVSHPQLASLGDDRFVLGYGSMRRFSTDFDGDPGWTIDLKVPQEYHLFEVDAEGVQTSEQLDLPLDVGWGAWDELVPLGDGRVAWAYTPTATLEADPGDKVNPIIRDRLNAHVYTSAAQ